jgi:hypothetical protein
MASSSNRGMTWLAVVFVGLMAVTGVILGGIGLGTTNDDDSSASVPPLAPLPCVPASVLDTNGTYCDDKNVCTQDVYYPAGDYCENPARSGNTGCATECFVPNATSGRCRVSDASCQLANYTECGGYCPLTALSTPGVITWTDPACNALFPRNIFFINGSDLMSQTFAMTTPACWANQCVRFVIGPAFHASTTPASLTTSFGNAFADCMEILNPALTHLSCISATSFMVGGPQYSSLMNVNIYGDPVAPVDWTARVCMYRYGCARWNATMINDPAYTSASAMAAAAFSTADADAVSNSMPAVLNQGQGAGPAMPANLFRAAAANVVVEMSRDYAAAQGDNVRTLLPLPPL